jgi:hypothetical protein
MFGYVLMRRKYVVERSYTWVERVIEFFFLKKGKE